MTAPFPESPASLPDQRGFYARRLAGRTPEHPGAVLAPMAGYSDAPMRQLCAEAGALWTVSEMISSRGLVLGNETEDLIIGKPYPGEEGRVVQLFGAEPELLAEASKRVADWFNPAAIDLNMGCPVPKVRGKGGACLLQTPEVAYELISAMRAAVPLDVSAKIRLGFDTNRAVEVAQGLEAAGVSLITVHGRTSKQRYTGEADWDAIAEVTQSVGVPVIGSGDVLSAAQARERLNTGVAAVMIGRGAVGQPWVFTELADPGFESPDAVWRATTALRHTRLNAQWYGEWRGIKQMRKVLPRYLAGTALMESELRGALVRIETLPEAEALLAPLTDPAGSPHGPARASML
ncbi:tRNA dihydrouridine synthase [Deinococcus alpinitundrae]|uniref:tRNA dihydrouridine synthase n=1 Tax=Deinococcus alpinitundrae TaxID=468913 RepID=UPI001ED8DFAF|nr:tRNA-dihydrouridine synthase family protein [Deinococcus alpinitundrae]